MKSLDEKLYIRNGRLEVILNTSLLILLMTNQINIYVWFPIKLIFNSWLACQYVSIDFEEMLRIANEKAKQSFLWYVFLKSPYITGSMFIGWLIHENLVVYGLIAMSLTWIPSIILLTAKMFGKHNE